MFAADAHLLDGTPLATPEAIAALRAHALAAYPQECVGYIRADGDYVPLRNVADHPNLTAVPEGRAVAAAIASGQMRALCHSHPGGPDCPSEVDMRTQIEMGMPFIIVSTNGQATDRPFAWGDELRDDRDLVGRSYRHVVDDCYATIRRWQRVERGIILPDYPRNWEWWLAGTPGEKDLYRRYFADAGFRHADRAAPREGDVWLASIRSDVPNHGGVYLDGGLTLHHPSSGLAYDPSRLSKRESIARWSPFITDWLRKE